MLRAHDASDILSNKSLLARFYFLNRMKKVFDILEPSVYTSVSDICYWFLFILQDL